MIVRCERCETRFKLDEARLPARGARVRCSRCKHAFFVIPPGSSREDLVHDLAAETAAAVNPTSHSPGPTWDLEDGGRGPTESEARQAAIASPRTMAAESDDDNDWRFEDDLPGIDAGETAASLDLTGSAPTPPFGPPADANEDSLADLGDPETWDLLSNDAPAPTPAPAPAQPVSAVAAPIIVPESAPSVARAEIEVPSPVAAPVVSSKQAVPEQRTPAPAARLSLVSRTAGWASAAALSVVVAWASLSGPASTSPSVALAPVAGFAVTEARARILDNAVAGPVLVVSGRLRNPEAAPRALGAPLRAQLLDAAGAPLDGATVIAGPALSPRQLREDAPERLRAVQDAGAAEFARTSVEAGGELRFDAVFGPLPSGAAGVALATAETTRGRGR